MFLSSSNRSRPKHWIPATLTLYSVATRGVLLIHRLIRARPIKIKWKHDSISNLCGPGQVLPR